MVCLQCNNCVIQRRASHNEALYKSIFLFYIRQMSRVNSRNDLCHDDSTINTVTGIIIIIIIIIIITISYNNFPQLSGIRTLAAY